jgi:NAD(P)-dependent dehydrogenase (short-subunit alcohol dehydrogenase family)
MHQTAVVRSRCQARGHGDWMGVKGRRVLMTGATSGIGLAAAKELAARGAKLAIVARNEVKTHDATAAIRAGGGIDAQVDVLMADLASQAAIRRLAGEVLERYPTLHVLINNAGVGYTKRELSEDGVELTWAVNHLAPFLLTTLLIERLQESAPARIVTTAANAHRGVLIPFDDLDGKRSNRVWRAKRYRQTKLANILFTAELAQRLRGTDVTANCFHPGAVATGLNRRGGPLAAVMMIVTRPLLLTAEQAAETMVWLADTTEVIGESGGYFVNKRRVAPAIAAQDMRVAKRLWEVSEVQVGKSGEPGRP